MPHTERANKQKLVQTIDPATITATTNGTGVDTADFGALTHVVNIGESGDTLSGSVYMTVKVQESDDDSTYTDAANDDVLAFRGNTAEAANGVVIDAASEDDAVVKLGYVGNKRYSRAVIALTGSHSNGTPVAATAVLEEPEYAPVSD